MRARAKLSVIAAMSAAFLISIRASLPLAATDSATTLPYQARVAAGKHTRTGCRQ
jgi:hypothetical protein